MTEQAPDPNEFDGPAYPAHWVPRRVDGVARQLAQMTDEQMLEAINAAIAARRDER